MLVLLVSGYLTRSHRRYYRSLPQDQPRLSPRAGPTGLAPERWPLEQKADRALGTAHNARSTILFVEGTLFFVRLL